MKKKIFYTEYAYAIGLILLALSTSLMVLADFGVSMVVAPAYILHLKVSQYLPFFSFGMAEYTFQAILLIFMILILKRAKLSYLFSFVTAVIYGFLLDGITLLVAYLPSEGFIARVILYVVGMLICSFSIALLFRTYISPEVYEMFVKEVSAKLGMEISKFKTIYDCVSCLISIIMSFAFFGLFVFKGVQLGTVICALVNGSIIGAFSKILDKNFEFKDKFGLAKYF
ncbi:MAG: hypothetical protein IKU43_11620 [Clostridia bacterium]|nr:hypothetical protein [Clostridia bacterium]